ncbi:phage holin family protein [Vagococcus xieshaowenii]|uniref:Phage holin family protein n=2 Tax=Vagococcus xieshaowenii TaxID=2562451 RepID=A0AAJ5EFK1_9ENTE|nr:phage holin family protein [Vagococcus xieshaowenii]TFZ42885.1 phage holin family protein [Vagococcus xieshaowenii]
MALAYMFPNMLYVNGIVTAIMASVVFSVLNTVLKPILQLLSFPISCLTFGLFTLVINASMLLLTAYFMGQGTFYVNGLGSAVLLTIIISLVNALLQVNKTTEYRD